MNGRMIILLVMAAFLCLPVCAGAETSPDALYVKKVENLPEDFIFGKKNKPADPRTIQRRFQRLLQRAELPPIPKRSPRKSRASKVRVS